MKIAIGTDHRGLRLVDFITRLLESEGHVVADFSPPAGTESADYPDFAEQVAHAVARREAERGILSCGTGIGMSIAANKVPGIRAAVCWDVFSARRSREHNDANVLCIGSDIIAEDLAEQIIRVWIETEHEGGRHQRRVRKIHEIEEREARGGNQ